MANAKHPNEYQTTTTHGLVAGKRLYLTADNRVVEASDPEARTLLCMPGDVISQKQVERLGLKPEDVASRVPLHLLPELQISAADNRVTAREKLQRAGLSEEQIAERLAAAGLAG